MTAPTNKSHVVLVSDAAHQITKAANRYCGVDATRKAARRLGAYTTDAQGRGVIPKAVVDEMARNFAAMGYLIRRLREHAG
jgi:hypothetical protein